MHLTAAPVEWSGKSAVNLGGLPVATYSIANGINDFLQAVGSTAGLDFEHAVEWSDGRVVNLGLLPGFVDSVAHLASTTWDRWSE